VLITSATKATRGQLRLCQEAEFLEKSIKVLIVEDEFIIRLCLADDVRDVGFDVIEAATADEAIEILESRTDIRVVFTDVQMPGSMDGVDLAHCIRRRWPPTVLIVSSGRTNPSEAELPIGTAFLPKPYSPLDLSRLLAGVSAKLKADDLSVLHAS
jgi:two-component system, response regulator PdtaR